MPCKSISSDCIDIFGVKKYFQSASLFNKVISVLRLILFFLPATNTPSERPFSAMKRIKSYQRTTMGQEWLNGLMVLHVQ